MPKDEINHKSRLDSTTAEKKIILSHKYLIVDIWSAVVFGLVSHLTANKIEFHFCTIFLNSIDFFSREIKETFEIGL